jgi:hypothetical protein
MLPSVLDVLCVLLAPQVPPVPKHDHQLSRVLLGLLGLLCTMPAVGASWKM